MKIFLLLLAVCAVKSSTIFSCNKVKVVEKFDFKAFVGFYYQYLWFSELKDFLPFFFGECPRQKYELVDGKDDELILENRQKEASGNYSSTKGIAVYKYPNKKNGVITVTVFQGIFAISLDYQILAFYPGKFIIVYQCKWGLESAFVLTMLKTPNAEDVKLVNEAIDEAHKNGGPSRERFEYSPQENCKDADF